MYRLLPMIFCLLLAPPTPGQEKSAKASGASAAVPAPFSIKDVLEMLNAKVSEDIIVGMIAKQNLRFVLSPQDVVALTKAGASERVMHQLDPSIPVSKSVDPAVPPPAPDPPSTTDAIVKADPKVESDPNDPSAPHKPGIYLYTEKNGERKMVEIDKTVPQSSRTKNTPMVSIVKGAFVYAFLPQAKAVVRSGDHQPVFYFYVGETTRISAEVDSPGQLALVKMEHQTMQGLEGRRMAYAKVPHAFSQPIIGTDPKALRFFKHEQTGPKAFRLIPNTELESGEYCFFFNSGASTGWNKGAAGSQVTLWDFGID